MRTRIFSVRALAVAGALMTSVVAALAGGTNAVMLLQRLVDTPSPGPLGKVTLSKRGDIQRFRLDVRNLSGTSYGAFYGDSLATGSVVYLITTLNRHGTNDHWSLEFAAAGAAPAQLPVTDLEDLEGLYIFVADPSAVSNFVDAVLFAPFPSLTSAIPSYNLTTPLLRPLVPPSTTPTGYVRTQFSSKQGRSVFEVRARKLPGGNVFSLWLEDPVSSGTFTNIADLPLSASTTGGRYRRDTRRGETLPLTSGVLTNLSGRLLLLRDAFGDTHLYTTIP